MKKSTVLLLQLLLLSVFLISSCKKAGNDGRLFIIGGGEISSDVIDKMITESGIDKGGYGVILPMSSEEPDTAAYYTRADFTGRNCQNVYGLSFKKGEVFPESRIDSIRNAKMVFISGGDQSRFMDIIAGSSVKEAIHTAFNKGGLICGTSAGAALMSKKMITGIELKYPENDGVFKTIEANNIQIIEGLGMLEEVIIDQHFIKRKRLNRLISACIENPEQLCVGIDESTAILVDGNCATVYGANQVVVVRNKFSEKKTKDGLLGASGLDLAVFLPGDKFSLKK
jgi:cyanophycinase